MSSDVMGLSYSTSYAHTPDKADSLEVSQMFIDEHYLANTGLTLLAGKNFPEGAAQREQFMIVNEEFVKVQQLTQPLDAIGKIYRVEGNDLEVIGVVKNFHFASLRQPIESFYFRTNPAQFQYANLKVAFPEDAYASLSEMEKVWGTLVDNRKFQAKFFEDEISEAYDFYQTLLKMVGFLGLLALSISLLGLLGMVVYTSEGKTKEVGIRKVLGATTTGITILLSKDYLKLMLWAAAIAIPITVLIFDKLISGMQYYSITLSVWDVLLSLAFLLVMGLTTIASQTYKTASTNPAETLKYE
jgi:ABC-type transport system, involved in lipoprotein release, permease component